MNLVRLLIFCSCFPYSLLYSQQQSKKTRPNIIIILADDLGYGDLSINGGDVTVPNLEQLAKEGLRFTDFHSNGAVCSPTRAALLTGRYQQRMGIEKALNPTEAGLGDEKAKKEVTFVKYLRDAGYFTGVIGKWHLGSSPGQSPLKYGFNEFWGMLHGSGDYHSRVTNTGTYDWWHNDQRTKETGYNTGLITKHSLEFIENHKEEPFFLYVAQNAIHFPWQQPDDTAHMKEGNTYKEVSGQFNKLGQHKPDEVKGVVKTMITEMDKSVGQIMAKLRELRLDSKTLVIFCSDNGGIIQYKGGYNNISSNKPYRGEKGNVYEGGHRVPAIAWWPGKIAKGSVTSQTVMTMDLAPTILEVTDITTPATKLANKLDGVSVTSLLFQNEPLQPRKLFWKHRDSYAVRWGFWKLVVDDKAPGPALYNLENDIQEQKDAAAAQPEMMKELMADLEKWKKDVYSDN